MLPCCLGCVVSALLSRLCCRSGLSVLGCRSGLSGSANHRGVTGNPGRLGSPPNRGAERLFAVCPNKRSDVKGKAETVETPETAVSERLPAMIRRARRTRALVVAVALALGLAACTSDDSPDDASSDNDASDAGAGIAPIGESTPPEYAALEIPDGRIDDAVDQLDDIAQNALDQTGVPGMAIAVVHDDEIV